MPDTDLILTVFSVSKVLIFGDTLFNFKEAGLPLAEMNPKCSFWLFFQRRPRCDVTVVKIFDTSCRRMTRLNSFTSCVSEI